MPYERIERPDDPRVDDYRAIAEPELVRQRGLFIIEGRLVLQRAIEAGRFAFRSVLVNDAARKSLAAVLDPLAARVPVLVCDARAFPAVTGFNIHRGCLALAGRPPSRGADALIAAARRVVVLDGVANADNVGGVFRNAAAFGADAVLLAPGTCDPLYRKAIRTSMAATLQVPFARLDPWPEGIDRLRRAGLTVVALTPREPAEELAGFARRHAGSRLALVVGTEGSGLSDPVAAAADARVRIAIEPHVDSLNVSVATAIALYALRA